jgi:cell division septum initiation protein DivIVA
MDPIKEAFDRIKQDILVLKQEIFNLKQSIFELKENFASQTTPTHNPTDNNPFVSTPTHFPTHPTPFKDLKTQNITLSTGNRGVPTDNPTNRQTIQQTDNLSQRFAQPEKDKSQQDLNPYQQNPLTYTSDEFGKAKEILDTLDNIKKEIRLKFKRLTPQEMQVFSTLYSLQEQNFDEITYKILSQHLRLTESSIRDYINRLAAKGIPILKIRLNNKKITLKISPDLQRVASLATILKLREI